MLAHYEAADPVVVTLSGGGVLVAYEVAHALAAPLDIIVLAPIRPPDRRQPVLGVVASDTVVLDDETIALLEIPRDYVDAEIGKERAATERARRDLMGSAQALDVRRHTVIIVDDGLTDPAVVSLAIDIARQRGAQRVVVAMPACSRDAAEHFAARSDTVICAQTLDDTATIEPVYDRSEALEALDLHRLVKLNRLERTAGFRLATAAR